VQLGIAGFYYLVPLEIFIAGFLVFKDDAKSKAYDEIKGLLWSAYDRSNPLTMEKALMEWYEDDSVDPKLKK
jgi:hypothetical protein